jgi:hypothetical protein
MKVWRAGQGIRPDGCLTREDEDTAAVVPKCLTCHNTYRSKKAQVEEFWVEEHQMVRLESGNLLIQNG